MHSRLLQGDRRKISRFHDFAGNRAPLRSLINLPRCVVSAISKKLTHKQPSGPWLGYSATSRLERLIDPKWRVVEFGAGSSTAWFAQRCAYLLSVESDPRWYERVTRSVAGLDNVELLLEPAPHLQLRDRSASFDFALVDGGSRDLAMTAALLLTRPAGYIYFDNSDVQDEDHRKANELLLSACGAADMERIIDFSPGHVSVTQGTLARLPG